MSRRARIRCRGSKLIASISRRAWPPRPSGRNSPRLRSPSSLSSRCTRNKRRALAGRPRNDFQPRLAGEKEGETMWKGFQKPKRLAAELESLTDKYGKFSAQPFERGWGTTVGNSLRRALLSSIEGAAITAVKIEGVLRGFSPIPGVGDRKSVVWG